jgi:hypothetical protein
VREVGFRERVKSGGGAVTVRVRFTVLTRLPEVAFTRRA